MSAIGMNEIMSIPLGYEACDAMLKASSVELVSAGCVCAGKFYIVVTGEVAAVRSSVEAGKQSVLPGRGEEQALFSPFVRL